MPSRRKERKKKFKRNKETKTWSCLPFAFSPYSPCHGSGHLRGRCVCFWHGKIAGVIICSLLLPIKAPLGEPPSPSPRGEPRPAGGSALSIVRVGEGRWVAIPLPPGSPAEGLSRAQRAAPAPRYTGRPGGGGRRAQRRRSQGLEERCRAGVWVNRLLSRTGTVRACSLPRRLLSARRRSRHSREGDSQITAALSWHSLADTNQLRAMKDSQEATRPSPTHTLPFPQIV